MLGLTLVSLLLVATVSGQVARSEGGGASAARARILGRVLTLHGDPIAGAEVVLHSSPPLLLDELDVPDTVHATTDARGRFRANVLDGRRYAAFAFGRVGDRMIVSDVAVDLRPAALATLVEAKLPPVRVRLQLIGLAGWNGVAQLRPRLADALGRRLLLSLDEKGEATLPPLPGPQCQLDLLAGETELVRFDVPLAPDRRQNARAELERLRERAQEMAPLAGLPDLVREPAPPFDVERILVSPPLRARFRVIDGADKSPVAGARITFTSGTWVSPFALSDAQGEAEIVVPWPGDAWGRRAAAYDVDFTVAAEGYALARCGWSTEPNGKDELPGEASDREPLTVRLGEGASLRGRFLARDPATAARQLVLVSTAGVRRYGFGYEHVTTVEYVCSAEGGRFAMHGLIAGGLPAFPLGNTITALVVPHRLVQRLAGENAPRLPTSPLVLLDLRTNQDGDLEGDPLDLDRLAVADLQASLPDGSPARSAHVEVVDPRRGRFPRHLERWLSPDLRTDERGRCRLLLLPGRCHRVLVLAEGHYREEDIEAEPGQRRTLRWALGPPCVLSGHVVDVDGKPVVGATVGPVWVTLDASTVARRNVETLKAVTDASGAFRMTWIPGRQTYRISASLENAGGRWASNDWVDLGDQSIDKERFVLFKAR